MGNQRWGTRASCRDFSPGARLTFRAPVPTLRRQIKFQKAAFQKSNSRKQPSRAVGASADSSPLGHKCKTLPCAPALRPAEPPRVAGALEFCPQRAPRKPRATRRRGAVGIHTACASLLVHGLHYLISLRRQNTGSKTELLRISRCW